MPPDGSTASVDRKAVPRGSTKEDKKALQQIYYDMATQAYYGRNFDGEFMALPTKALNSTVRRKGFYSDQYDDHGVSDMDSELLRIAQEDSVHFAGPVGGFDCGFHEILGKRILVTSGPKFIKPVDGNFETFGMFLSQLFGDQKKYFLGWIKHAQMTLSRGLPWSPGQMLAVAGPAGSGKSVLQSLLTLLLGGRVSSPYEFMAKGAAFNAEVFGAEHALIGDQNHKTDYGSRRNFGSAIKNLVVNPEQYVRGMYKAPVILTPFLRVSLTLNDNPEALAVLPPFDSDVADKVMLLRAAKCDLPIGGKGFADFHAWRAKVVSELPAFLFWLRRWSVPEAIRDRRYGVVSYHDAGLVENVYDLSPEQRLWQLIETYLFTPEFVGEWVGTSSDLQSFLENACKGRETRTVFPYSTACGQLLAKLEQRFKLEAARLGPDWKPAVCSRKIGNNRTQFTIRKGPVVA